MTATALAEELNRLEAEITQIEARIGSGRGGIVDHILLAATRRTHATTLTALNETQFGRSTLPGVAPVGGLYMLPPAASSNRTAARAAARVQSGTQCRTSSEFWVSGTASARSADTWRPPASQTHAR
jgi:hypothetical protein